MKSRNRSWKMEKLIKYNMHIQHYKKRLFEEKKTKLLRSLKTIHCLFLWMMAFKTHLDLIGKSIWIGKMINQKVDSRITCTICSYIQSKCRGRIERQTFWCFLFIVIPRARYRNNVCSNMTKTVMLICYNMKVFGEHCQ